MTSDGGGDKHREARLKKTRTYVGSQLRLRRKILGIALETLAEQIGMRTRHLEACELGEKDLTVSELCALAQSLSVPPWYFYDGLGDTGRPGSIRLPESVASHMLH